MEKETGKTKQESKQSNGECHRFAYCMHAIANARYTVKYVNDERQGALGTAGHRHAGPYPPIVFVYFVLSRFVTSLVKYLLQTLS